MVGKIALPLAVAATLSAAERPNILFITVDDLKTDLGCYGDTFIKTPNIDRLAARGTVFLNNYCQQALCAPSRMSMFTGLRPDSTHVTDLKTDLRTVCPDALTLQEYFIRNGYESLGCGKVMHGSKNEDPPSWSVPFMRDENLTYAKGYDIPADLQYQAPKIHQACAQIEKENIKGWKQKKNRLSKLGARPATECIDVPDDAYADGAMANWSIAQMQKLVKGNKPFFLTVGFHKPHLPFAAPKKYWDLYDRADIHPSPIQQPPEDSPSYAGHNWGELRSYSDIPKTGPIALKDQPKLIQGYYACVSCVDAQVGKLLDALDASGAADSTIIVLWGDNGWHLGDHGWWCKHTNYEQATHTPLIIVAPGFPNPEKSRSMTEFVDVYPTVCELAGLPIPKKAEGKSLVPLLKDPAQTVGDYSISQFPRGKIMGYALRTERYRYVEWIKNGVVLNIELYDYQTDPLETKSLHNDPEYSDVLGDLKEKMAEFLKRDGGA